MRGPLTCGRSDQSHETPTFPGADVVVTIAPGSLSLSGAGALSSVGGATVIAEDDGEQTP